MQYFRGRLELSRGRDADALVAFRAAERLAERLDAPNLLLVRARAMLLYVLARLGDTEAAEQILEVASAVKTANAARYALPQPRFGWRKVTPVRRPPRLHRSWPAASILPWGWLPHAFLLEAIAQDALGDPVAAGRALEARPRPR